MNRTELEVRAHLGDVEAGIRLLRYDARHKGETATVEVEKRMFGYSLRINGWHYGGGYLTVEDARREFEGLVEKELLRHQLLNWASILEGGDEPYWWPRCCENGCCDHHRAEEAVA